MGFLKRLFKAGDSENTPSVKNIKMMNMYSNNTVVLVHDAAKLCYSGKYEKTYKDMLKYIALRVKEHHESILEHSNIIMLLKMDKKLDNALEIVEIVSSSKYLNYKLKQTDDSMYLMIGGSIRGYKNIFRNIPNSFNELSRVILRALNHGAPKEFFVDFLEESQLMDESAFENWYYDEYEGYTSSLDMILEDLPVKREFTNPGFTIAAYDDLYSILDSMNEVAEGLFTEEDLLDMCTVTVYMKDISRIITQMITRHDNATSQRSQRYVDETKAEYRNPLDFTDYIPKDMKFKTSLGEFTLDELAKEIGKIYSQLRSQGLHKEDARMFLTENVLSDLYMTFTYRNLIWFLSLRTDSHTQSELNTYSKILEKDFICIFKEGIYEYIKPMYLRIIENLDADESLYCEEVIED